MKILIATKIELSKIFAHKKYKVLLVIQSIISIVLMLFTSQKGFAVLNVNIDIPSMPYTTLSVLYTIILPMMIIMLVSDLLSSEIENGTIKSVFLRPIERIKIYISKLLGVATYIFINLMLVCVIMFLSRLIFGGYTVRIYEIFISYIVTIIPMITFIALVSFLTQIIGNTTLASFCSIILYIVMQCIGFISLKAASALFTSHFGWYRMFLGSQNNLLYILNILLMNFAYTVLLTIFGYVLFNRKEL